MADESAGSSGLRKVESVSDRTLGNPEVVGTGIANSNGHCGERIDLATRPQALAESGRVSAAASAW